MTSVIQPYPLNLNIIFHGNDIDGWMAAYIISVVKGPTATSINFFPVSPTKQTSWPSPYLIQNSITYIVSTVPTLELLTEYDKATHTLFVIDHHASSKETLHNFNSHAKVHKTSQCSTELVYKLFFPSLPVPEWISLVDRLARWQTPSLEDKALREILHPIACMVLNNSIETVLEKTHKFLGNFANILEKNELVRYGLSILSIKDETLANILKKGQVFEITNMNVSTWNLPTHWTGKNVFVLNNTGIVIDSTLASSKIFDENTDVDIFLNYRTREVVHPRTGLPVTEYSYSVRARNTSDINLIENGVFAGHACAAGAKYYSGQGRELPFIV